MPLLIAMLAGSTVAAGEELLAGCDQSAVPDLIEAARRHGVEAWLAACAPRADVVNEADGVDGADGADGAHSAWLEMVAQRAAFQAARIRTAAVCADLDAVFARIDCPWLVVKGPALAQTVYPSPQLRFGVDLDVLVPPARLRDALSALADDGRFELIDLNWPLIEQSLPGELRLRSARGILIDLHWSLINTASVRRGLRLDAGPMLERRRNLESGLPVLAASDQLVHLGVHGALSGANRLSWLLDAHLAARTTEDWTPVLATAAATETSALLGLVLVRAQRVFRTPVPDDVLRALAGGRLGVAANRAVLARSPIGDDPDRPTFARSWARCQRSTARATMLELLRHGMGWLRAGRPKLRPWSPIAEARDPRSPLHPVDDPRARDGFLDTVAASG